MAQASRPRSRLGLAMPRLVWRCMNPRLAASDAWRRPHALALALAWRCLASYGCVCILGSLPLMHGSDLAPLLMAEASPPRSRLGLAPPRLVWLSGMLGSPPLMHGSCLTPSPPPWLGSVSYGCVCMLGSLPVMHGSGLTPTFSPWLGHASPRRAVYAS